MDIVDIMLARAMTPQGQTETYVAIANAAAAKAEKAETDAQAAIDVVSGAAEEITAAQEAAADLLAEAQEALETAQAAQINTLDTEDVDEEIKKLNVAVNVVNGNNANTIQMITTYPDNTLHTENITKLYKQSGTNEDGTMTQKAIKSYVDSSISAIPTSSGSSSEINIHFTTDDEGHIIIVGQDGSLQVGDISESDILAALLQTGTYNAKNAVGLNINYVNKTFNRLLEAANQSPGEDFNKFLMYGGRMRCNVADDGTINAFYGENGYTEDGSNGQVMIYQPKFYYQRVPTNTETLAKGKAIREENIMLSTTQQVGFKVAPIFLTAEGEELDYVLFSAYEAGINNGKLTSIANSKPVSDKSIGDMESAATARGAGWHIENMAAVSANQMLQIVEYGSMNGQNSLELGISNIVGSYNKNCSSLTGSTSSLGNTTGHADSTVNDIEGATTTYTDNGRRAISYRGLENPWGNIWHMIGGTNIFGNGTSQGGAPYVCTDFDYTPGFIGSNYEDIGFNLPSTCNWISSMGYGNSKYDWVFLPAQSSSSASSALPIGDNLWVIANVNTNKIIAYGGAYGSQEDNGPFYYAADHDINDSARPNYGARIMFIPTKNTIYNNNITKWTTKMGV